MPVGFEERLVRTPMSLEAYLALPEGRVEWVDGEAIFMNAAPRSGHQNIGRRLANLIEDGTSLYTVEAVGFWTLAGRKSRIPDVLATREPFADSWAPQVPVLTVEVLSPSTRREDTVPKSAEYLAAGVEQYWVVDPARQQMTVYGNAGERWEVVFTADEEHPAGSVQVGEFGTVDIDLAWLLRL
jgi:Uma2 family endonuclease